ncbi:hypothetical protein [Enterococcus olivae]
MKEALERVRQTEEENQRKKQELLQKLFLYKQEKEEQLEEINRLQQKERNQLLEEIQHSHQEVLSRQKQELTESLKVEDELNEKIYQDKQAEILAQIIEGVKQVNGS